MARQGNKPKPWRTRNIQQYKTSKNKQNVSNSIVTGEGRGGGGCMMLRDQEMGAHINTILVGFLDGSSCFFAKYQ